MLSQAELLGNKDNPAGLAGRVEDDDIAQLVDWLEEKDDTLRYAVFLLLQALAEKDSRVYRYWDVFAGKLGAANSYQRSLGLMLLAANVRWDEAGRFAEVCGAYLGHCDDEKFITARQCIQGLNQIIDWTGQYDAAIVTALTGLDLDKRKDSQKTLLRLDSLEVLGRLYRKEKDVRIRSYLEAASEQADERVKKAVRQLLA